MSKQQAEENNDYVMRVIPDSDPYLRQIRREFFEVELDHLRRARAEAARARELEGRQKLQRARFKDSLARAYAALARR